MLNFERILQHLSTPAAWLEALALGGVLLAAYALTRTLGARASEDSVLFGRNPVSGLMFPLLALVGTYACEAAWVAHNSQVSVFHFALPVLMSLALIRLMARVVQAVFPRSDLALRVERTVSWLAWIGAVLWIAGFLPWILAELESIRISFGKTKLDLRTLMEGVASSVLVLVLALGSVTVQDEPDLLLISQVSPAATVKLAVLVTGAVAVPATTVAAGTFSQRA